MQIKNPYKEIAMGAGRKVYGKYAVTLESSRRKGGPKGACSVVIGRGGKLREKRADLKLRKF